MGQGSETPPTTSEAILSAAGETVSDTHAHTHSRSHDTAISHKLVTR